MIQACLFATLLVSTFCSEQLNLTLLHISNIEAKFDEVNMETNFCKKGMKCRGGSARMSAVIKKYRGSADSVPESVLFLIGGSVYPGSVWYATAKEKIAIDILNAMRPDAVALSPYEFDPGIKGLSDYVDNLQMPVVSANMNVSQEPTLWKIKRSLVLMRQERKIGIVGVINKHTPEHAQNYGKVTFNDEIAEVAKECKRLNKMRVDLIIVLGSTLWETNMRIAKTVPHVNVIVGCQQDYFLYNGDPPTKNKPKGRYPVVVKGHENKKVYLVASESDGLYLGHLNIYLNESGVITCFGQPIYLEHSLPKDPDVEKILNKYRPAVDAYRTETIAHTYMTLEGSREICYSNECNLGNLIADSFVWRCLDFYKRDKNNYWTDTSVAIFNSGMMKQSIVNNDGKITRDLVIDAFPFDQPIYKVDLLGKELLATFEQSARQYKPTKGYSLQVAGVQIKYDFGRKYGHRVEYLRVRCAQCRVPRYEPIKEDKVYRVVVPSYILSGGHGYKIGSRHSKDASLIDERCVRVVESYMKYLNHITIDEGARIVSINVPRSKSNIIVSMFVFFLVPLYMCLVI